MAEQPLLAVRNLKTYFYTDEGVVKAVDGLSYDLHKGETLGIVGESGCGKSVHALSILRLLPEPPDRKTDVVPHCTHTRASACLDGLAPQERCDLLTAPTVRAPRAS